MQSRSTSQSDYFFVAVSSRRNLEKCMLYDSAGFPEGQSGLWPFVDIAVGDYLTFLYGASAYNLYRVREKIAFEDAERVPPDWDPVEGRSGKRYFPFRLLLERVKIFQDSIAKDAYKSIAENLLRRGGYRKSHFQADLHTLNSVSAIEEVLRYDQRGLSLDGFERFEPRFALAGADNRKVFRLNETILQSLIRRWLKSSQNRQRLFSGTGLEWLGRPDLEVIGERALPEGYADIMIHDGLSKAVAIFEVKLEKTKEEHLSQVSNYLRSLSPETAYGFIISKGSSNFSPIASSVRQVEYRFTRSLGGPVTFSDLLESLELEMK